MKFKEQLRHKVAFLASAAEIAVSILVLAAVFATGIRVAGELTGILTDPDASGAFNSFLGHAFNLVIGLEFIKMMSKHTPGSAIEVLLFAIARQMIVEHTTPFENFLTVVTIAGLFAIRKFLFVPSFGSHTPDGHEVAPDVRPEREK